ncbi:L,D-transpeptidase [Nocardiopsis sediminis]|uniref:L,D-transpeptidase n=1 Tax=Nocardiopsis sediminis TaxID=1778267 RepID=A0ABV8FPG0_9ACTN
MHRSTPAGPRRAPQRALLPLSAFAFLAVLTACSPEAAGGQAQEPEEAVSGAAGPEAGAEAAGAEIATVTGGDIDVFAEPGGEVIETLESPNSFGVDRTFLVERTKGEWLEVLLPVRPNGSTGWVRSDEVELSTTLWGLRIDLGEFTFAVNNGEEEVRSGVIGTGESETPTPPGRYYFTELLRPPDPDGVYGAYAFGLSGFSETLETFAGGPGQLAVHGTDDEGALGREVSHGCIRVANDDITWMAENLPIGTPVEIDA